MRMIDYHKMTRTIARMGILLIGTAFFAGVTHSQDAATTRSCLTRFPKDAFRDCDSGEPKRCMYRKVIDGRDYEAFRCLVNSGSNPNVMSNVYNVFEIPIINVSLLGDIRFLKLFPVGTTDWEIRDAKFGRTALLWLSHVAEDPKVTKVNSLAIARYLIRRGANVNAVDNEGFSAIIVTATSGQKSFVDLLLANDADPNQMTNEGKTALMLVGEAPSVLTSLLRAGADRARTDKRGKTAFLYAMEECQPQKFKLLVSPIRGYQVDTNQWRAFRDFGEKINMSQNCAPIWNQITSKIRSYR